MSNIIATLVGSGKFDKYAQKDSLFTIPQQEKVDAKDKNTPEYCAQICKSAFAALMRNKNSLPSHYYSRVQLLRDYLTGSQDEDAYVNLISSTDPTGDSPTDINSSRKTKEGKMKGYEHLQTQIVSSMPAIRQAIQGLFSDYDEFAFVNTIDQQAGELENEAMAQAYTDIELKPYTDQLAGMGVLVDNEPKFPLDITREELQIYKEMGGFKAKWAEGIEQLIFFTQKQSDWDTVLKRKFIDDYLATNWVMAREVYDKEKDIVRWEYVDIANATIQYSTDRLFRDAEYAGYFTMEKISKLVLEGFDSEQLRSAAKVYSGMFDNGHFPEERYGAPTQATTDRIMDFRIPVFHYYWIETDVKRTLKINHKYGTKNVQLSVKDEVRPLSEYKQKKGYTQEERKTKIRTVRQCSWVVDTDMTYNTGILANQARKSKKEPQLPFFAYKEISTNANRMFGSIVENVIPFLDRQQILWLKYQDALAKAHPGGYMVNMRLLQNLEIAGQGISPLEAFEMFWKYGRGVYLDTALDGKYEGGAVLPISQIPGNYGELLSVLSTEMEYVKAQIRDYTGIDPTTVGIATQGTTATEVSMAKQGTNNILRPMIKAIYALKSEAANYSAKSIQLKIRNIKDCYKVYSDIVGKDVTDLLVKMERDGSEFGMGLEAKPSDEELKSLMEAANAAMSVGRDGDSQIDLGQWMYIQERILNGGNIKKLRRDVAFMIRKKEEKDQQATLENVKAQAQEQERIAQSTAKMKQQEEYMKAQADILKQDKATKDQLLVDKNMSDLKIKEMVIAAKIESEKEVEVKSGI